MRRSSSEKAASRERILSAAARQFREQGIAATGLSGIMAEAGLTVGAFYAHFQSKEDLVGHVLDRTLNAQRAAREPGSGAEPLSTLINAYLSSMHRDAPGEGCATAALVAEISRQPGIVRGGYTTLLQAQVEQLASHWEASGEAAARERAIATFGMLVGCLQLARAVEDAGLSEEILGAGRRAAEALAGRPAE